MLYCPYRTVPWHTSRAMPPCRHAMAIQLLATVTTGNVWSWCCMRVCGAVALPPCMYARAASTCVCMYVCTYLTTRQHEYTWMCVCGYVGGALKPFNALIPNIMDFRRHESPSCRPPLNSLPPSCLPRGYTSNFTLTDLPVAMSGVAELIPIPQPLITNSSCTIHM